MLSCADATFPPNCKSFTFEKHVPVLSGTKSRHYINYKQSTSNDYARTLYRKWIEKHSSAGMITMAVHFEMLIHHLHLNFSKVQLFQMQNASCHRPNNTCWCYAIRRTNFFWQRTTACAVCPCSDNTSKNMQEKTKSNSRTVVGSLE